MCVWRGGGKVISCVGLIRYSTDFSKNYPQNRKTGGGAMKLTKKCNNIFERPLIDLDLVDR